MQDFCFARKVLGEDFLYDRHVNYLLKSLRKSTFGTPPESAEAHRLSSLFFVVSGLDLLGALDTRLTPSDKEEIIHWIYSYQVDVNHILLPLDLCSPSERDEFNSKNEKLSSPTTTTTTATTTETTTPNCNSNNATPTHAMPVQATISIEDNNNQPTEVGHNSFQQLSYRAIVQTRRVGHAGFRASGMIDNQLPLDCGTLTMSYCALATLVILGDDLARLDRKSIIQGMRELQLADGSFRTSALGGENDMRIVYCAAAVSSLLNDWSGIDKDRCARFIRSCLSHEGAFAQHPGAEAHGGSTFCALASLKLMSKLEQTLSQADIDKLIRWCMNRLDQGFSGRPNKDQDTCYSFWIGACLVILNHFEYVEQKNLLDFILIAQEERGGLSKVPDFYSDPLHTYLGFAGLTFIDDELCLKKGISLLKIDPTLNISLRARRHLDCVHRLFSSSSSSSKNTNNNSNSGGGGNNSRPKTTTTENGIST